MSSNVAQTDLYVKIKNDAEFQRQVLGLTDALHRAEAGKDRSASRKASAELLKLCNYNPSLLVPHFFPQYPRTEPLSLLKRPFTIALMDKHVGGFTVIRGSRQIGKTTTFCVRLLTNAFLHPNYRCLMVLPHPEHLNTIKNRLAEMSRACRYKENSKTCRQNLTYREYSNGSIIELIRVLTNADEARSKTTDELIFDEYQLFDVNLQPELEQTQKASEIPIINYAGTSTTLDSPLETRWDESSQGTWHLKGPKGWIDCGDKETVMKCIRQEGFCCPKTGQRLDVTKGQFIHQYIERANTGLVGLHIPQVVIPEYAMDPLNWAIIWRSFNQYDDAKFLQEIMGIPTQEGAREITVQDLQRICVLGSPTEGLKRAQKNRYAYVISGCDWGGSDYNPAAKTKQSYTVHAIIGVLHDGKVDILSLKKYAGMGYREIIDSILTDHKTFGASCLASDFGVGMLYNTLIREDKRLNPSRHAIMDYGGPNTKFLSLPKASLLSNLFVLNRTESITALFEAIKKTPEPRIRCYNWETAEACLMDFLNMYRVVSELPGGHNFFVYRRHGARPDDTLHAINFAYTLGRLLLGEAMLDDPALKRSLEAFKARREPGSLTGKGVPMTISG